MRFLPRCCCAGVSAAVLTRKEKRPSAKSSCVLLPASWLLFSPCRLWATALPLNSIPRPNFSLRVIFTLVTCLCFLYYHYLSNFIPLIQLFRMHVSMAHAPAVSVEANRPHTGVSSLSPTCGSWGSNSGCWT